MTTKIEKLQKQINELRDKLRKEEREKYLKKELPNLRERWQGKCFLQDHEGQKRYFEVIAIDDDNNVDVLIVDDDEQKTIKTDVVNTRQLTDGYKYDLGYECHNITYQEFVEIFEKAVNQMRGKVI
jgi:predicted 2-oxoglutarate/Fe(II)-dependent dioxygenase YbiX